MTSYCTRRLPHALVNAHATSSMTSPCLRHRLFLSAASYLFLPHFVTCWISLRHTYFTRLRRHSNSIKRQHKTRFTHSPTQQRQRHYSSPAGQLLHNGKQQRRRASKFGKNRRALSQLTRTAGAAAKSTLSTYRHTNRLVFIMYT